MKKNIIIVDIDGTVSKVGNRLKYLQQSPKDWDSFYEACNEDNPIESICNLIKGLDTHPYVSYELVFCTGRRESVREKTEEWIDNRIGLLFEYKLLMRKNGDFRHDTEVKPELLKEAGISIDNIAFILEDRNSMVKKWRELGFTCLQVADGDF
jgi:hypothetical protein